MNVLSANMVTGDKIPLNLTNPKHMAPGSKSFTGIGKSITELEKTIGADSVTRAGTFEQVMLQSLDKVSGDQQFASSLAEQAITDPDSVDIHDLTISQAKAGMSLNITRNILSRLVQGWKDIINVR
ncbi:flagellar hook-basal body complex protein FliE [Spirochaetia bacterium]|nr:flagellar hook-basal body complex protein FliE [Spirochaetia bacterium]